MRLGRQSKISKLSKAIWYGFKMGKERGIKRITGALYKFNSKGEVCGACALGFAGIAKFGTDPGILKELTESAIAASFKDGNTTKKGNCLMKTVSLNTKVRNSFHSETRPKDFVMSLNDVSKMPIGKIADKLAECKL